MTSFFKKISNFFGQIFSFGKQILSSPFFDHVFAVASLLYPPAASIIEAVDKLFEQDQETPSSKSGSPAAASFGQGPSGRSNLPPAHSEAIDQFISEFKKEVDKITGDDANITVTNVSIPSQDTAHESRREEAPLTWEDGAESLPAAQIRTISKEMIEAIARRVAEQLVARIDSQVVYAMIKDAIYSMMGRHEDRKVRRP